MPPPKLAPAWLDYRTRLACLVLGVVGLVLWAGGIDRALGVFWQTEAELQVVAAAWLTGCVWALVRLALFPCPYCGKWFHMTMWVANPITSECLNCGFSKWRDPDAARAFRRR